MAEAAKIIAIGDQSAPTQPEKAPDNGQNQLPGESALWFRRYCLYRDLGYKRSLRAAVAKERKTARLVKEPETATKSTSAKKSGVDVSVSGQKRSKAVTQSAPAPVVNVPGSWKNASKVYHWQKRAHAFDAWLLNKMAEINYEHLGETCANKFKRVKTLDLLIKSTIDQLNSAISNGTTHKNYLAYVKQLAALLAQMENEMHGLSEDEMKAAISAYGLTMRDDIENAWHQGSKQTVIVK